MRTSTVTTKKKRPKYRIKLNKDTKKHIKINDVEETNNKVEGNVQHRKIKNTSGNRQEMFVSSIDPYDVPLKWWEQEYVRYAISYPQVRSPLETIMRSPIVRLTDRRYMLNLMSQIKKNNEKQQNIRIEKRKITPPSIITQLLQLSYNALTEKLKKGELGRTKVFK